MTVPGTRADGAPARVGNPADEQASGVPDRLGIEHPPDEQSCRDPARPDIGPRPDGPAGSNPLRHTARLVRGTDVHGVDAVVATSAAGVRYLTGVASLSLDLLGHRGRCCAVVLRDRPQHPWLVAPRGEIDQFLDAADEPAGVVGFGTFYREDPTGGPLDERMTALRRVCADAGSGGPDTDTPRTAVEALAVALTAAGLAGASIAVEGTGLSPTELAQLRDLLPRARIVEGAELLAWVRTVKTAAEIDRLTTAVAATEDGIRAVMAAARPGVTERDLVAEFHRSVVAAGVLPRFALIKFGDGGLAGQTRPGDVPLRAGQAVWLDVGGQYEGYWSDLARVFSVGEPSAGLCRRYGAVLTGQRHGIAVCRPGTTGGELFTATVQAVRAAGLPHYRRHNVGHGIGLDLYDPVPLVPDCADPIEVGTVVNIETPYHEFGFGSVQVEDPFVVEEHGNRLLTTLPGDLAVV